MEIFIKHGWQHNLRIGPSPPHRHSVGLIGLYRCLSVVLFSFIVGLVTFGCVHPGYAEAGCRS